MKRILFGVQIVFGLCYGGIAAAADELVAENLAVPGAPYCQRCLPTAYEPSSSEPKAAEEPAAATEEEPENKCRWCTCGKLGDAWKLPEPCVLQRNNIDIGGWVQSGVFTNDHGAPSNGPLGFNNLTDFNAHQLWMYAERKTNTEESCFDWGGRVDYVFGVDGPDTQAFGDQTWDYGWNSSSRYGSAIPQLYLELAYGDWSVKGGRFYTPIGYEVVPATGNFFYTHSYMMYYAEPFTHTGFLATRKINDKLSAFGGWVDGWDSGFENDNHESTFLGGTTATLSEKASVTWALTAGNWGNGAVSSRGDIFMNSLVFTYKANDKWTYVLHHDLGVNNIDTDLGPVKAQWYGITQYLLRQINDCWSAGARMEWFRDEDGVRVVPGNEGNYYEATLGLNYKPHANFLLRPELRWDWYSGEVAADNHPFNNGRSDSQFGAGFDMIFTF